jgi:uncharacterized protein YwqG
MPFASERAALEASLAQHGLGAARDLILANAVPCFRILADGEADDAPVGATRLGGVPDLPQGVAWPRDQDGRSANFFGQFDFAGLASHIDAPELPREGLLLLFVTYLESAAKPVAVKALLAPKGADLLRAQAPEDDEDLADPDTGMLAPVFIRFAEGLSLPFHSRAFRRSLAAAGDDGGLRSLITAFGKETGGDKIGQLLGFASPYDDTDFYRMLYFHRIGRGGYEYLDHWGSQEEYDAYVARQQSSGTASRRRIDETKLRWLFDHQTEIGAAAAEWRLLLRIDSNRPMKLNINDADPIYFLMPEADLAKGDFSRVEAGVTQG